MKRMRFQEAIRSLSGPELADLGGCLGRDCDENGITGELLGLCLVDAMRRAREDAPATEEDLTAKTPSAPREEETGLKEGDNL